ncbi:hypothetical protein CHCC20375_1345 [Bacillus licheniformis]|nr:hypothetical protein CHCC20375_1345 [Bacillus licheniformis]
MGISKLRTLDDDINKMSKSQKTAKHHREYPLDASKPQKH